MTTQSVIIYYGPDVTDITALKQISAAIRGRTGGNCFLRASEKFNGELERIADRLPDRILLIGDSETLEEVAKAYEAAEIKVEDCHLGVALESEDDQEVGEASEQERLAAVKAEATELGINFHPDIGEEALQAKIDAIKMTVPPSEQNKD